MTNEEKSAPSREPPAAPPRILIDARRPVPEAVDFGRRLLGLAQIERTVRAARRCGYACIVVLARAEDAERFRALLRRCGDVHVGESVPARENGGGRTIAASAILLGERSWLEAVAAMAVPDGGILHPFAGVAVCGPAVPWASAAAAIATATADGGGADTGAAAANSADAPFAIRSEADLAAAERRLLQSLGKKTDGFMERNLERPISARLSACLANTAVTPNLMTLVSAAVGLSAAPFFLSAAPLWQTIGALLFVAHSILDGCDGELARLKFQESRWGGILDFWVDNVVHSAIFACMSVGWSVAIEADWPLALGAAAVLGTLGSAGFVYWRVMRSKRAEGPLYTSVSKQPSGRLTSLLDSLSRRDFIYLVLLLSIPGKAAWFLALAAAGAPIFFILLLVVAAKDRRAGLAAGT